MKLIWNLRMHLSVNWIVRAFFPLSDMEWIFWFTVLYCISESNTFYYQEPFRTDIRGLINEVLHFETVSCFFVTSPWPCHNSGVSQLRRLWFSTSSGLLGFVVDEVALEQVVFEYFSFTYHLLFHKLLRLCHHHQHPGLVQYGHCWPAYQMDSVSPQPTNNKVSIRRFSLNISGPCPSIEG
jgi:hypothetical protein